MNIDDPNPRPLTPVEPDPDHLFHPDPPTHKPIELKLALLKPFTGNREELNSFLLNVSLYLTINKEIYDTSQKKIGYALSFMTDGDAKLWKDQYLKESNKGNYLDLGTWSDFKKSLKESFEPYDASGDAMEKIINLKKGDATIKDHITKYKVLLRKSKIPEDSLPAIDYFK